MSTGFAVAAATLALADRLHALIGDAVPGAQVTTHSPASPRLRTGEPIVNLSLFRALRNGFVSNRDVPTRDGHGKPLASPTLMLDLDYMISFYGDEAQLDPQRLLGLVAGGLNAWPHIRPEEIRATIAATPWLSGAGLDAGEPLRVTPMNLPPDAMARLWSEFVNVPYQLTMLYTLTPVALVVPLTVAPVLPVRRFGLGAAGAGPIPVAGIVDAGNPALPLAAGAVMAIRLARTDTPGLTVRLDDRDARFTAGVDAEGRRALLVPLDPEQPGPLRAGPLTVQVVRTGPGGAGIAALSNPARVTILPALSGPPVYDPSRAEAELTLALAVPGAAGVVVLLFPVPPFADGQRPPARSLPLPVRSGDSVILRADVSDVAPGRYLVSIEVDGLKSLLRYDDAAGGYAGPILDIGPDGAR